MSTRSPRTPRPRRGLDAGGVLAGARQVRSPNCDARPPGSIVSLVVIHNISLPPGEFGGDHVIGLFTNTLDCDAHPYFAGLRGLRVSAHFYVPRSGAVIQFVPCIARAWHAGVSTWRGRSRCNDFSIGIELEGTDTTPYADAQYRALVRLVRHVRRAFPIEDIVGHADIAPGRKSDPGPAFDWPRLRAALAR